MRHEKWRAFQDRLREELAELGVKLVWPDLGFLPDGRHVWHLTVEVPRGAVTLYSPLPPGVDPYASTTITDLVRPVRVWLRRDA